MTILEKNNPNCFLCHHFVLCDLVRNYNFAFKKNPQKSEREKHSQDQNKNSQETIIMSINIIYKFTNTMILCSRKRFKNQKYFYPRIKCVLLQSEKKQYIQFQWFTQPRVFHFIYLLYQFLSFGLSAPPAALCDKQRGTQLHSSNKHTEEEGRSLHSTTPGFM